jgi:hypothetical protein
MIPTIHRQRTTPAAAKEYLDYFHRELDREVGLLLELLGSEALLIPEIYGGKRPRLRGWNQLTHAALDSLLYIAPAKARALLRMNDRVG